MRALSRKGFDVVLQDQDGCLIDSNDLHDPACSDTLARFGQTVPASRIRPHIGKGGKELLREFVTVSELDVLAPAMGAVQTEIVLSRFGRVRPFPGASASVRGMRQAGMPVVLARSADPEVVRGPRRSCACEAFSPGRRRPTTSRRPSRSEMSSRWRFRVTAGDAGGPSRSATPPTTSRRRTRSGFRASRCDREDYRPRRSRAADAVFDGMEDLWSRGRELFA